MRYGCKSIILAAGLGAAATNPVSNLVQLRLQNQYAPESYNADSRGNTALVQAVIPLSGIAGKFDSIRAMKTA